ncbi:chemotaxis protein CheB [Pontibacter akesuensis]|uniref:protein-glutamate methylesterase n=1 Tax=Pontibacter akesuensis TaxID=388950 RepID=A0A1I7FQL7_9BACT|nr:chemotaxis protein CheB [Pontibacter akesuensis]GHA61017.1 chemotaxis response regulator protein-glutamate methylesterase [Pontibacter akesuensis]SFU38435.1 two-component system, chemotaxis family, response regulator CheB [Pontibacter akesuensis]
MSLKVLIAEKSSYCRLVLQDIIGSEADLQVQDLAADGEMLMQQLAMHKPDMVVLDYELPMNENLLILKRIFSEVPVPVLLLVPGENLTLELLKEAVALGVYAVVQKPSRGFYINYRSIAPDLLLKVRAVQGTEIYNTQQRLLELQQEMILRPAQPAKRQTLTATTVIVIGASTGGTQAVESIIRQLAPDLQACVLIALHLPEKFTRSFTKRLQSLTQLSVAEGKEGQLLKPGKIFVAPGGRNMEVQTVMGSAANLRIGFNQDQAVLIDQPSIDLLMKSIANTKVEHVVGVILTGMGKDGTQGAASIISRGGVMVAQDEGTAAIFGMARSAIESGYINKVLPLQEIPHFLNLYVAGQQQVSATDSTYEIERTGV